MRVKGSEYTESVANQKCFLSSHIIKGFLTLSQHFPSMQIFLHNLLFFPSVFNLFI